jgi:hypothetical protein
MIKSALAVQAARTYGIIHPPCLVIPCRVASPQSPTPFRQTRIIIRENWGVKQVHPAGIPVIDGYRQTTIYREASRDAT